jgi:polar amino acid transport system ATP-binding protein
VIKDGVVCAERYRLYMRDGKVHEMGCSDILRTPGTPELAEFISETTEH